MNDQLDLFGADSGAAAARQVGPAPVPAWIAGLAPMLPHSLRLGTSSWSFPGWRGLVWDRDVPPAHLARYGLAAYARHPLLTAVEIDRSFYQPVAAAVFAHYADTVPADFRFVAKAHRLCTSPVEPEGGGVRPNPLFLDADHAREQVVQPFTDGLGERAGVLIFQFSPLPPALTRAPESFAERLADFLARLPAGVCIAVELRDPALLCPEYFAALAATGAVHCFNVHPRMPDIERQFAACPPPARTPLVIRWVLRPGLRHEEARLRYWPFARIVDEDRTSRERIARLVAAALRSPAGAWVMSNNKAEGCAPESLFRLAATVAGLLR